MWKQVLIYKAVDENNLHGTFAQGVQKVNKPVVAEQIIAK